MIPGFLSQCGSLERFREFIGLFHAKPESRKAFIDAYLERCWVRIREMEQEAAEQTPRPSLVWSQEK